MPGALGFPPPSGAAGRGGWPSWPAARRRQPVAHAAVGVRARRAAPPGRRRGQRAPRPHVGRALPAASTTADGPRATRAGPAAGSACGSLDGWTGVDRDPATLSGGETLHRLARPRPRPGRRGHRRGGRRRDRHALRRRGLRHARRGHARRGHATSSTACARAAAPSASSATSPSCGPASPPSSGSRRPAPVPPSAVGVADDRPGPARASAGSSPSPRTLMRRPPQSRFTSCAAGGVRYADASAVRHRLVHESAARRRNPSKETPPCACSGLRCYSAPVPVYPARSTGRPARR